MPGSRDVQKIMAALQTMPDDRRNDIAKAVAAGQTVEVAGKTLQPDELLVAGREKEGFASAEENGAVVIVSTDLTPELLREGLARELVHRIQNLRKDAGFDIADRIRTYITAGEEITSVLHDHETYIKQETLSEEVVLDGPPVGAHAESDEIEGYTVTLAVARV